MATAAKLALSDPPPSCGPVMVASYKAAMHDLIHVNADVKAGNYNSAASDIAAAGNAIANAAQDMP